jgi:hypothetical protein
MSPIIAILLVLLTSVTIAFILLARKYRQVRAELDIATKENMRVITDMKTAIYQIKTYQELLGRLTAP